MDHSMIFSMFKSSVEEEFFRKHNLKDDILHSIVVFVIMSFVFLCIIPLDYSFSHGDSTLFTNLLRERLFAVLCSVIGIFLLKKSKQYKTMDRIIFVWIIVQIFVIYKTILLRPNDFLIHSVNDILFFVVIYLFLPNKLSFQVVEGFIYTAVNFYILVYIKEYRYEEELIILLTAFFLANFLGILVSWRLQHFRRRRFELWKDEKILKEKFMKALEEIKTLKGIIPICSQCKSIRNDEGFWNNVEEYFIEFHDEAQLSHSLCPKCYEKAKGQIQEEIRMFKKNR